MRKGAAGRAVVVEYNNKSMRQQSNIIRGVFKALSFESEISRTMRDMALFGEDII